MIVYVDIDNTITHTTGEDYAGAVPIPERIEKINKLFKKGHFVIYWTARGTGSGKNFNKLTETQLDEWGCRYHKLKLGKPAFDILIDDKTVSPEVFFERERL